MFNNRTRTTVGASTNLTDLAWLDLPDGFCAHFFASVASVRTLRFAPSGDLFAASPSAQTVGSALGGLAEIVILPDDNGDGVADGAVVFLSRSASSLAKTVKGGASLWETQGLLFADGSLYFQDGSLIRRLPFEGSERRPAADPVTVIDMAAVVQQATIHWPKALEAAADGTILVSNGGAQADPCRRTPELTGAIFKLRPNNSVSLVARGFRNPIAIRCEPDHPVCLAIELAQDFSDSVGGREKIVPVREGDDWGHPCCATRDEPFGQIRFHDTAGVPDCSKVAVEAATLQIGETPFGLDFELGSWPHPWRKRAFVTLHGAQGTWTGARIIALALDPATGLPLPASDLDNADGGPTNLLDFAVGWDDGSREHGRPGPVTFSPDGRLFVGDDQRGLIFWVAPVGLTSLTSR
ncbi:MAG: hypothetical protein ACRENE_16345 [Polyangiaceae bacterium]